MENANPAHPLIPDTGWQLLGELELPSGAASESAVQTWIVDLLSPLNFSPDFLDRVLKSAQDVSRRATLSRDSNRIDHIHLIIWVPSNQESRGLTWGFFRVEKIRDPQEEQYGTDHAIEFYLYREGD